MIGPKTAKFIATAKHLGVPDYVAFTLLRDGAGCAMEDDPTGDEWIKAWADA